MAEKNIRLADISIGKIEPSPNHRTDFLDRLTDRTYDYRAKHVQQSLVPRHTAFGQADPNESPRLPPLRHPWELRG